MAALSGALPMTALAKGTYDVGASDKEIKLGNLHPYSGPASAYGTCGKSIEAYFKKVNASGGVNGRRINFVTLDDAYNPAKSVEMTRKLVEQEEVLCMFASLGSSQNIAVQKYLNARKVPQLFVNAGTTRFGDYKEFPWTMGWQPTYQAEGRIYARHILENHPNAKIGVLMQNDDFGKDNMKGLLDGLGDKAKTMITQHLTYDLTDPTIDSALVKLKSAGCDVFVSITTPKFAAQAIRKVAELGWKPAHYLASVSQSVSAVLKPAGFENAKGIISAAYIMETSSPAAATDPHMKNYFAIMKEFYPSGDPHDTLNVLGYSMGATMVQVLKQCGDELTRANVMKQAANLKNFPAPLLFPGIECNTSPTDYYPVKQKVLQRFNGQQYEAFTKPLMG
ncbi:branched-chain amino acid ABC transporter substrate-binding protein [Comamonas serinivorans]|uniref:Branched-chain amino acid ABC transporter substrate-binding protein n=2 Tax=Comamonas serinivorans TaxID=1082851 RepID=A0A1Y0EU13_9BURK|nr:branched-chain amino acid ABC transporter substrate-binding protein [Comamonas serinivorans]